MSLTVSQIISLSVVFVGILMVVESFLIVGGKGVDVNGELPFMFFGTMLACATPILLQFLGPWSKSWYWYIFIGFLLFSGFMSYIRSRGFMIRIFEGNLKSAISGVEKALKQSNAQYVKEIKETSQGTVTQFKIGDSKYPIEIRQNEESYIMEPYIEIIAPEALWNADLKHELMIFVNNSRRNRTTGSILKGLRKKIIVGVLTVFLGAYLFGTLKL